MVNIGADLSLNYPETLKIKKIFFFFFLYRVCGSNYTIHPRLYFEPISWKIKSFDPVTVNFENQIKEIFKVKVN